MVTQNEFVETVETYEAVNTVIADEKSEEIVWVFISDDNSLMYTRQVAEIMDMCEKMSIGSADKTEHAAILTVEL